MKFRKNNTCAAAHEQHEKKAATHEQGKRETQKTNELQTSAQGTSVSLHHDCSGYIWAASHGPAKEKWLNAAVGKAHQDWKHPCAGEHGAPRPQLTDRPASARHTVDGLLRKQSSHDNGRRNSKIVRPAPRDQRWHAPQSGNAKLGAPDAQARPGQGVPPSDISRFRRSKNWRRKTGQPEQTSPASKT